MFARGKFINSANSNGRLDSNGVVPYGAFGMPLGKSRFSFGVAVMPELIAAAKWNYVDASGGAGGISYGALHHDSELLAVRSAAAIGVELGPKLQIGATVGAVYNANTLETAYVFQIYPALAGLKTLLNLHTSGVGWNGSVGALVRPLRRIELGVAYKSRTTVESKGVATGNAGVQFAAIGLGALKPDFRYDAEVDNVLPQSMLAHIAWRATPRLRLVGQIDWINWKDTFANLSVILTRGNNADINGLLGTDGIKDSIPLHWRDQVIARIGLERSWLKNAVVRAGFARSNDPVPGSTLSPLTAAITRNTLSAGFGYQYGRCRFDVGYSIDPTSQGNTQQSLLKAGEYNDSIVKVGTQALMLSTSFRL
jgi:long-subunit fatty acid transport protein